MENSESKFKNGQELEENLQKDFMCLQTIAEILRTMGLEVLDRFITAKRLQDPTSEMGFPIVMDGAQGIRVSYSKKKGLKIWFTNGFADSSNPKRQEIEKRLREAELL